MVLHQQETTGRVHGRVRSVSDDREGERRVTLEVASGDHITLTDPSRFVDQSLVGSSRTLEVTCRGFTGIERPSGSQPGIYADEDEVTVIGRNVSQSDRGLSMTLPTNFHRFMIKLADGNRLDSLSLNDSYRDSDEECVMVHGVTPTVTDCYYQPAFDPFVPAVAGTCDYELVSTGSNAGVDGLSLVLSDAYGNGSDNPYPMVVFRDVKPPADGTLIALVDAITTLLSRESTIVTLPSTGLRLELELLTDGVRYVHNDTVRVGYESENQQTGLVDLIGFARATANAAFDVGGDDAREAGERLRLVLLRRGVATLDDRERVVATADPWENYEGFLTGYALDTMSVPDFGALDENDVNSDEILEWGDLERNYEASAIREYIDLYSNF